MWFLLLAAAPGFAGDGLFVKWKFTNIEDGYDHDNRMVVYVDGQSAGMSAVSKESKPGKMKVSIPAGSHEVRVIAEALYEGNWEEHTVANDYSVDCEWTGTVSGGRKTKLSLLFDIGAGTTVR
jgi:hypothetical protein